MNDFLQRIEDFLKKTGMSATAFGIKTKKNPNLVFDLRKGAGCTLATMDECDAFMASYELTGGEVQPNDFYGDKE